MYPGVNTALDITSVPRPLLFSNNIQRHSCFVTAMTLSNQSPFTLFNLVINSPVVVLAIAFYLGHSKNYVVVIDDDDNDDDDDDESKLPVPSESSPK